MAHCGGFLYVFNSIAAADAQPSPSAADDGLLAELKGRKFLRPISM